MSNRYFAVCIAILVFTGWYLLQTDIEEYSPPEVTSEIATAPEPSVAEIEEAPSDPIDEQAEASDEQAEAFQEEAGQSSMASASGIVKRDTDLTSPTAEASSETVVQKDATSKANLSQETGEFAENLCREIGNKLGSVDISDCLAQELRATKGKSAEGRDLAVKNYPPTDTREPLGKVLVIGGIHGDEFSSVSVVFKWMEILNIHHSGLFDWRFIPASNPDGLLQSESQRQNANGVDLNRNFPTADWDENAIDYWINKTDKRPRRYPGETANSEPETQWLVAQIEDFKPDVIISMHAPYHLVDYDGPPGAPNQLGSLYLRQLGVYPGSLGNYAGVDLKLPIVTVELASAGIMPSKEEISDMWDDLVGWLRTKLRE